ncbi:MAG: E3 binding domain-containing protein, partial [Ramlibacter sp.]|nr:E3 binding domain-containing protein [Cryobacterium sp.]
MGDFLMPSLGADMDQGKLVEWLVKPGDYVHRGDMVAVVGTEKADIDVEAFEEGVVAELLVEVGTTVPVGAALARITQTPAAGAEPPAPQASARKVPAREVPAEPGPVSPPVRQLAHQLGVDTTGLHGTGTNGAITRADVERAAAIGEPAPAPAPVPAPASARWRR